MESYDLICPVPLPADIPVGTVAQAIASHTTSCFALHIRNRGLAPVRLLGPP